MSRGITLRCLAGVFATALIASMAGVLALASPASAATPTWSLATADIYDSGYNQDNTSVITVTDSNGGITVPTIKSATPGTGFTCGAPTTLTGTTASCTITAAPSEGDDSGVIGANGTSNTVTVSETDGTGTFTQNETIVVYPAPICAVAPDGTGSLAGTTDVTYTTSGDPTDAEACDDGAIGPASTLLTGISASGGTIFTGANAIDAAGGLSLTIMSGPGFNWTGSAGSGEADVDTGTAGISKQTWSGATTSAPPPSTMTSASTVASEASFKSGDPLDECPPPPAMIDAGMPFCFEDFEYSGAGPSAAQAALEYSGQSVPTSTTPTVALSRSSGSIGQSVNITDASGACPSTIGTGSSNFLNGSYSCWYGRAGDSTPVTVTVGGKSATVTPTVPANGDVSEGFYSVDGPSDTATYDGAGTVTLMNVTSGHNTVTTSATSAGTATSPYNDLLGDGVSGTDIPVGTEVTNVVNNGNGTWTFTLSNNATATPAAETLTFSAVTLNPPQLNAGFSIPAGTPTGPQTVKVCETTATESGNDWEFGVQWMVPTGSLSYLSGNSGPTQVCDSSTIDVTTATSSTTSTPTHSSVALGGTNTDGATVTGSVSGLDPTGTVSFYACAEGVSPCTPSGSPFDTESLSGTANPASVTSAAFTPTSAGTWCFAAVYSGDGNYAGSSDQSADECYTVTTAPSSTTSTPTHSSVALGGTNTDGATVTGSVSGLDPTGTVSFYACAEGVSPCTPSGSPFDTESLSGTANPASVTSAAFTPTSAGTWCFAAVYSGDGNYAGSSDQSADECYSAGAATSSTTSTPTHSSVALGGTNTDGATVTGSVSGLDPTGTVSFYACAEGVSPCTPSGSPFDTESLSGTANPASVTSAAFTPTSAGTWCFAAVYSGDGNYAGSSDQSADECYTVTTAPSSTTSTPTHSSIALGGTNTDGATVTGSVSGLDPTGTVSFYACAEGVSPCTPSGSPFDTESLSGTANPASVTSAAFTPTSAGTWCFAAVYSGDGNYAGSSDQSADECYTVTTAPSSTTSTPTHSSVALGGTNTDGATVTGSVSGLDPTGTVSFYACAEGVSPCTPSGSPFDTESLSGTANPASVTSAAFTPTSAGTWCFAAVYSGDGNYAGSSDQSADECYSAGAATSSTTSTPTHSSVALGGTNTDGATVTGSVSGLDPTGTVSFYACAEGVSPCTPSGSPFDTESLSGTANPASVTSAAFTPTSAGTWCFAAVYSGDGNYAGSSDQSADECYTVTTAPSSTTSTPTHSSVALGGTNTDGATVTGSVSGLDPTGTVSFYACAEGVSPCTPSGSPFDTESLSGTANPASVTSAAFTPTSAGTWCFAAVYSGDGNYAGSSDQSADECYSVTGAAPVVTTQPVSQYYTSGGSLTFTAAASGTPTPTVQWQYSTNAGATWTNLAGATSTTLTLSGLTSLENHWELRAVFTNVVSSATSNAATMTLATAPAVTTQPSSQYYASGGSLTFTAAASGSPTPTVQWQYSTNAGATWTNLAGATSATLTVSGLTALENHWELRAVFTNVVNSATSNAATMTLGTAPVVTTQPKSQTYASGGSLTFTAAASGSPTPTVQWQYSTNAGSTWTNLAGATSTTLTVSGLTSFENGWEVRAVFTNPINSATSTAATMTYT